MCLGSFFGRVETNPFCKRSLKILIGRITKDLANNDVEKTLDVFYQIGSEDPNYAYRVQVDTESRIETVLWTNGRSRSKYKYFSDVTMLSTTYRANLYEILFGLFIGVNNHLQCIILGVFSCVMKKQKTSNGNSPSS